MKNILKLYFVLALMLLSTSSLEAASGEIGNTSRGITIGYNPTDFTFTLNGVKVPSGLMDSVVTVLFESRCSEDSSKSYEIVGSEDHRIMEAIEREIKLSSSIYADPATRLKPNILVATHLVKGDAIVEQGRSTINLRIEDRQGNVTAQAKTTGAEKDLLKLIDEASRSLGYQMCMPERNVQTCPYLWNVRFAQKGTLDTNSCFGSGLSSEEAMSPVEGYAYFPNVLIWPSFSYDPSMREETACDPYEKNDVYHYSAKSQGDTYQKIDGYDGIDADIVYLRASKMNGVERL